MAKKEPKEQSTQVADEQIITALLTQPTRQAAAEACGISVRTLYDRTRQPAFIALYAQSRTDLLRQTLADLRKHQGAAVQTIAEIMSDTEQKASTRLQAAQMILDTCHKYTLQLQAAEDSANTEEQRQQTNAFCDLAMPPMF